MTRLRPVDDHAFTCPVCKGEGREWSNGLQGRPHTVVTHDCRICAGTRAAAELVDMHQTTVSIWVRQDVGVSRGRGRPSKEELERQRPRLDCPCLLCLQYRDHIEVVERRIDRDARHRVPEPSMEWRQRAACIGEDPEPFFPTRGDDTRRAKAICAGCEVRAACREAGMHEHFGVWGGLSERERRGVRSGRRSA